MKGYHSNTFYGKAGRGSIAYIPDLDGICFLEQE